MYLDHYRKETEKTKEEVAKYPNWVFTKWLKKVMEQHGEEELYFSEDLGTFYVYKGYRIVSKTLWAADETYRYNEDGKLLLMALDVMDWKYGLSLPHTQIYWESLHTHPVGENAAFDEAILFDTTQYVPQVEMFLQTVQKQEDDEFFKGQNSCTLFKKRKTFALCKGFLQVRCARLKEKGGIS